MASLPSLYEYYTSGGISSGLSTDQPYFTLNNRNITIYSGALHYFRVPREYWRDRLKKLRAAGLNTVETYVPWNLHEPEPGVFDFGNGGTDFQDLLDVEKFLKIAQEEDLFAIVRPGPYICSEWEYGGMPSWLLREKGIRVRTSDEVFMSHVQRFFAALFSFLTVLQFTNGGPIIAFQIENEYAATVSNKADIDMDYLLRLKDIFLENGVDELLVTSDDPLTGNSSQIPGVLYTGNFQSLATIYLNRLASYQPGKPLMVMEYWSGWYDKWMNTHSTRSNSSFSTVLGQILRYPASVNFYMFHGGTNFGFMNGANNDEATNAGYVALTSSYDYDAPLTEAGDYTDKYYSLKNIIAEYNTVETQIPDMPTLIERIAYESIDIIGELRISQVIERENTFYESSSVIPMEELPINNESGQSYGYIVYRKKYLNIPANSVIKIEGYVCDTAMLLINGELKSKSLESFSDTSQFGYYKTADALLNLENEELADATLEIIVENWGRVNYGTLDKFIQFKGLWQGNVTLNDETLLDWQVLPLEFKKTWINNLSDWQEPTFSYGPALYKGILNVDEPKDTFIDMRNWHKGFVAVNGFVISRHLKLGPQLGAYLPAPFLRQGQNEIVIFEHFTPSTQIEFMVDQMFI